MGLTIPQKLLWQGCIRFNSSYKFKCNCKWLLPIDGQQLLIITDFLSDTVNHFLSMFYTVLQGTPNCSDTDIVLLQTITYSTNRSTIVVPICQRYLNEPVCVLYPTEFQYVQFSRISTESFWKKWSLAQIIKFNCSI